MSTSANVIFYDIKDKYDNIILCHRQNIMCKWDLRKVLEILNPQNYKVYAWGYDEDEEEWSDKPVRLDKWLKNHKNEVFKGLVLTK